MTGKYTEAQKKAIYKYFQKRKEEGRPHSHGTKEQNTNWVRANRALIMIKYLFRE